MYNVSDKFKTALKSSSRESSIYGTLTTIKGDIFPLDDSNIIRDSLYITNQIVNNNKLTFGAVYAGECGLVINSEIDRYSLFGAKIELNFLLRFEDGTEESLPLGVFYVDTPERIGSKIKLTAVDNMSKFDITVDEDVNGAWYELLTYMADKCGVELAQTQEELEALHINTTSQTYTIQQEKIDTYRDALAFMSMIICANATIDNTGKLKIIQFATTPCDSNDGSTRLNNCKFSDYATRYAGVTARFFASDNYYTYKAVDENIDGLMLNLGDIPIVGGTNDSKNETIQAILDTLKLIEYVPATLYISSNPTYELGDMIECNNINNTTDSVNTYVMAYKYDYRKKETINCYGENPLLQNIKDKSNNFNTSELEAQIASKDMVIVNATNIDTITIGQTLDDVVTLNFAVNTDCRPIVLCTVPFSIDLDGYVEFSLYNGLVPLENATYKGYYEAGEHFATFMYLDDITQGSRHSIRVMVRCYADVTSATRVQDARLKTLENGWQLIQGGAEDLTNEPVEVDTTEPTVTIAELAVKAIAYTQGIDGGKGEWDGTLEFTDVFNVISLENAGIAPFNADVSIDQLTPTSAGITDIFGNIQLSNVGIVGFSTSIDVTEIVLNYIFNAVNAGAYDYNARYVDVADTFKLKTSYEYNLIEESIDSGYLSVVEVDTSNFVTVESVVVNNGSSDATDIYLVGNEPVPEFPPVAEIGTKYLVKDVASNTLYTIVDGALSVVDAELTADTFITYGVDNAPSSELLLTLSHFSVLAWNEEYVPEISASVTATPKAQVVVSDRAYLTYDYIAGIENVTAICEGNLICTVSVDGRQTWKKWNGTEWETVTDAQGQENTWDDINAMTWSNVNTMTWNYVKGSGYEASNDGMSKEVLEAIAIEQWDALIADASGMYLRIVLIDGTQSVEEIKINYKEA